MSTHEKRKNKTSTLIIVAHPDIAHSTVNKRWLEALKQHPERYTVHELYARYPDGKIDVAAEQALVEAHDNLVWQFPVYWFNCPPLLKQWLDDVLTHSWAYGSKGKAFVGRKLGLAVSMGSTAAHYTATGKSGGTVAEMLSPFRFTANYVHADYQPPFTFHTIDSEGSYDAEALKIVEQSSEDYLAHLEKYFA